MVYIENTQIHFHEILENTQIYFAEYYENTQIQNLTFTPPMTVKPGIS